MPRNRIIYQSEAIYVGPSPSTGVHFNNYSGLTGDNAVSVFKPAIFNLPVSKANELSRSGLNVRLTVFTGTSGANSIGDVYGFVGNTALSAVDTGDTIVDLQFLK